MKLIDTVLGKFLGKDSADKPYIGTGKFARDRAIERLDDPHFGTLDELKPATTILGVPYPTTAEPFRGSFLMGGATDGSSTVSFRDEGRFRGDLGVIDPMTTMSDRGQRDIIRHYTDPTYMSVGLFRR